MGQEPTAARNESRSQGSEAFTLRPGQDLYIWRKDVSEWVDLVITAAALFHDHHFKCYTRSTPSYKLLSEYNLLLTQRLMNYPRVLGGLFCGSSSFAKVTDELPTSRNVVALRRKGD
jgi:hypothetical protein